MSDGKKITELMIMAHGGGGWMVLKGMVDGEEKYGLLEPGGKPEDIRMWKDRRILSSVVTKARYQLMDPPEAYAPEEAPKPEEVGQPVENTLDNVKPVEKEPGLMIIAQGEGGQVIRKGNRVFRYTHLKNGEEINKGTVWESIRIMERLTKNGEYDRVEPPEEYKKINEQD